MNHLTKRPTLAAILGLLLSAPAFAGEWSEPGEVRHLDEVCVTYRAKLVGDSLIVEAVHGDGWHTFAMDNEMRAKEKLAGQMSLGIDAPTEIEILSGLQAAGPWRQSPPTDFSKPELRWYSWGYEESALFTTRVARIAQGPALIAVRGQACSDTVCKNIDLTLVLPLSAQSSQVAIDLGQLEEVRKSD